MHSPGLLNLSGPEAETINRRDESTPTVDVPLSLVAEHGDYYYDDLTNDLIGRTMN